MDELLYKEQVFQLVGLCMEIHRELGKGHDEIIYKDALVVELSRAGIPFFREARFVGQFWCRLAGVKKSRVMTRTRHEFHEFTRIGSSINQASAKFVAISVIRV